jgi:integrase
MLKTRSGLPKYCCWNYDRHGKRRVRFRKGRFTTYITGTPWSDDFMRQYGTAIDGAKPETGTIGADRTKPGTVNALVVAYYRSLSFNNLKEQTQQTQRNIIEKFRADHGDKPLKGLGRAHVEAIVSAKSGTPKKQAANNLLKVLRKLLNYAVSIDMIASNPANSIKKYKSRGEGFHSWSEEEIAKFESRHAIGTRQRLAFALLLYTAQRRSDILRMGWQHVNEDLIQVRQEKTDKPLLIPIHPELARILAAVPRTNMTFLTTERGAPFTPAGFGNWFREQCNAAGLPLRCAAHGLRKAAATRLANAGCSASQIAAVTGHKTLGEVAHYTAAADQQRLARQALEAQLRSEGEQDLSNFPSPLDKNAK